MTKNKGLLKQSVGDFLKRARKNQCLSGHQLGKLMRVSQQQISRYERGETSINIETLDTMLDVLGKSWSDFFCSVLTDYSNESIEIKMEIQEENHNYNG